MTTVKQISCPEMQWNILVYFLKFGSSILKNFTPKKKEKTNRPYG